MNEKLKTTNPQNFKIEFEANLEFKGSIEEFQKLTTNLNNLSAMGVKIGKPIMPDDKLQSMMIDTVPLPEKSDGIMIGTWPTPEKKGSTIMIGTVPIPDKPIPGGMPVIMKFLNKEQLIKLTEGMPKFKLIKDIYGGMRSPHLHLGGDIYLLDKVRFREFVGEIAKKLGNELMGK